MSNSSLSRLPLESVSHIGSGSSTGVSKPLFIDRRALAPPCFGLVKYNRSLLYSGLLSFTHCTISLVITAFRIRFLSGIRKSRRVAVESEFIELRARYSIVSI